MLFGIKIVKSFTSEQIEIDRFRTINWHQYVSAVRRARFAALLPPTIEWLGFVGVATVFGLGCWEVITGQLATTDFLTYIAMVIWLFKPIKTIGNVNSALQQCLTSAERIFYILDFGAEAGQQNSIGEHDRPPEKSANGIELQNIRGTVTFQNVSFSYSQAMEDRQAASELVINNVSFEAKPGEVIALVGPSGSGKTTLLNLLLRFYEVSSGNILIDGIPISEVKLQSLRQSIALVPQDTFLFDGTILENIGYGCPEATDERIIAAAKKANAHAFITKIPEGYATPIGEAGG